jgi:hypothetical protein
VKIFPQRFSQSTIIIKNNKASQVPTGSQKCGETDNDISLKHCLGIFTSLLSLRRNFLYMKGSFHKCRHAASTKCGK